MNSLTDYFQQNFNTQREQWEKSLRSELKIEEIGPKTTKQSAEGKWPILSLDAQVPHQLESQEKWKKAAQTYVRIPSDIARWIEEDLEAGVRLFFFEKKFLRQDAWVTICSTLNSFRDCLDVVVILLGEGSLSSSKNNFRLMDENNLHTGRIVSAAGGNNIQELALLTHGLIKKHGGEEIYLGVFLDSHFFRNMAKVRAVRLLAEKVLAELNLQKKVFVVGLTNYRDWTLFERYSNILRNDSSVASGLIAGCDFVQSSGYQTIFELETDEEINEHTERSRRMSRNTSHILALESMLGVVEDASYGSYHLESLTEEYARGAWGLMQKLLTLPEKEISQFMMNESKFVREERQKALALRRHVLAGLNDFPDKKDVLHLKSIPKANFFRTGRDFEELRLKMEVSPHKPDVYLAIFGDYAALNARINFVKNYFELLGLHVTDPGSAETDKEKFLSVVANRKEKILVLVSADDQYESLKDMKTLASEKFLAGKMEISGFRNLFAGQNVLEVLNGIMERWGKA